MSSILIRIRAALRGRNGNRRYGFKPYDLFMPALAHLFTPSRPESPELLLAYCHPSHSPRASRRQSYQTAERLPEGAVKRHAFPGIGLAASGMHGERIADVGVDRQRSCRTANTPEEQPTREGDCDEHR